MTQPLPKGFRAAGVASGIYKNKPEKLDLAVFISEKPARAAAVFTTNLVQAAPILICRKHIKGGTAQAIVANSGCANACTGGRGLKDALNTAEFASRFFSIKKENVLVASTGVIGEFLPIKKIQSGLQTISEILKSSEKTENELALLAARAIMTTDTVHKVAGSRFKAGDRKVTIWGCAKGAGMIHPKMATMFSFVFTDALLPLSEMKRILSRSADRTFNSLTVDGDTSTNDCVFFLANGLAADLQSKKEIAEFEVEFENVCRSLAEQMAADGEGATKTAEIVVQGARTDREAQVIAETIATSPLVKTALFGQDPNWGRIFAAAGRAGVDFNPSKTDLYFGSLCVARSGTKVKFSEEKAKRILKQKVVPVRVDLNSGRGEWRYLTCDFSLDYVKINADYRS